MLEGVLVQVHILIKVVLICEKVTPGGEDEPLRHVGFRQERLIGILDLKNVI